MNDVIIEEVEEARKDLAKLRLLFSKKDEEAASTARTPWPGKPKELNDDKHKYQI